MATLEELIIGAVQGSSKGGGGISPTRVGNTPAPARQPAARTPQAQPASGSQAAIQPNPTFGGNEPGFDTGDLKEFFQDMLIATALKRNPIIGGLAIGIERRRKLEQAEAERVQKLRDIPTRVAQAVSGANQGVAQANQAQLQPPGATPPSGARVVSPPATAAGGQPITQPPPARPVQEFKGLTLEDDGGTSIRIGPKQYKHVSDLKVYDPVTNTNSLVMTFMDPTTREVYAQVIPNFNEQSPEFISAMSLLRTNVARSGLLSIIPQGSSQERMFAARIADRMPKDPEKALLFEQLFAQDPLEMLKTLMPEFGQLATDEPPEPTPEQQAQAGQAPTTPGRPSTAPPTGGKSVAEKVLNLAESNRILSKMSDKLIDQAGKVLPNVQSSQKLLTQIDRTIDAFSIIRWADSNELLRALRGEVIGSPFLSTLAEALGPKSGTEDVNAVRDAMDNLNNYVKSSSFANAIRGLSDQELAFAVAFRTLVTDLRAILGGEARPSDFDAARALAALGEGRFVNPQRTLSQLIETRNAIARGHNLDFGVLEDARFAGPNAIFKSTARGLSRVKEIPDRKIQTVNPTLDAVEKLDRLLEQSQEEFDKNLEKRSQPK